MQTLQKEITLLLSAYDFGRFLTTYHREKRWVTGQVLNLQQSDVQKIFDYLEHNANQENREYFYDYFFNNCSTKPYDVIAKIIGSKLVEPEIFNTEIKSHRQLHAALFKKPFLRVILVSTLPFRLSQLTRQTYTKQEYFVLYPETRTLPFFRCL